jgi:SAM-dependent methyltransferase
VSKARPALEEPKAGGEAWREAQRIAFAPVVFQVARSLRDLGVLTALRDARPERRTTEQLIEATGLSRNGLMTLLEAGLSFGLTTLDDGGWGITDTSVFLDRDHRSRANLDFVQDVCWAGLAELPASIRDDEPRGLPSLGDWDTVYAGLRELDEPAQSSWFSFDHLYSDLAFPRAWGILQRDPPKRLLDVGGNTGRFARFATGRDPEVEVTILDLPSQVALATAQNEGRGRIHLEQANLLDATVPFPTGFDAVWMSQFLVCFSLEDCEHLMRRGRQALAPGGSLWILDTFWDRQTSAISTFCLHGMSPYFVAIASGKSRVYPLAEFEGVIEAAGLQVVERHELVGPSHTLLRCQPLPDAP